MANNFFFCSPALRIKDMFLPLGEVLYNLSDLIYDIDEGLSTVSKNFIGGGGGGDNKTNEMNQALTKFRDNYSQVRMSLLQGKISLDEFLKSLEKQQDILETNLTKIGKLDEGLMKLSNTYMQLYNLLQGYSEQQVIAMEENEKLSDYLERANNKMQDYGKTLENIKNKYPDIAKLINIDKILEDYKTNQFKQMKNDISDYLNNLVSGLTQIKSTEGIDEYIQRIANANQEFNQSLELIAKNPDLAKALNLEQIREAFKEAKFETIQSSLSKFFNSLINNADDLESADEKLKAYTETLEKLEDVAKMLEGIIPKDVLDSIISSIEK